MIQLFRYELRSQRKRFFIMSIMIAIALSCYMIIDSFIVYADNRVAAEAKPLAGADIIIESKRIWDEESNNTIKNIVGDKGIISKRVQLNTNITTSTDSRLVQLRAVESPFPLYGKIEVKNSSDEGFIFGQGIAVDQKTFDTTDNGKIKIGERETKVDGIIQENPGLSLNLFTQGRQVIMPLSEIEKTGLLVTGSRSDYQYLIKVLDPNDTKQLLDVLRKDELLKGSWRIDNFQARINQVGTILDELGVYVLLVIFCAFLLVAVTSMLSIDEYLYRRLKSISIMQILGARKKQLLVFYGLLFLSMSILSIGLSNIVVSLVGGRIQSIPDIAGFIIPLSSRIHGIQVALILIVVAWSLPLIKILLRSPLEGLADSVINISTKKESILSGIIIITGIIIVLYIIGETRTQTFILGGVLFGGFIVIRGIIRGLLWLGNRLNKKYTKSFILFDSIRSTTRPGNTSILIASTLIVALSTSLLIMQFGGSFIKRLTINNENQPNRYIINLRSNDLETLRSEGISDKAFNVVLGRIVSINDASLADYLKDKRGLVGDESIGRFTREYNITTAELDKKDTITGPYDVPIGGVSIDKDFAKDIGIQLGDKIEFSIAGRNFFVDVTSLRKTDRTNFTPFFYFQLNAEQFKDAPMTYFLTMKVAEEKKTETRKTIAKILQPGVAFIEIDTIIGSVRSISNKIIYIVQVLLLIILLFTVFTNIVCVENMRYAKAYKMKLYHILGANISETRRSIIYEYGYILGLSIVTSMIIGFGVAAYFIGKSSFLSRSWIATGQGLGIIVGIIVINGITIWRTMK